MPITSAAPTQATTDLAETEKKNGIGHPYPSSSRSIPVTDDTSET